MVDDFHNLEYSSITETPICGRHSVFVMYRGDGLYWCRIKSVDDMWSGTVKYEIVKNHI